ncbi:MAG: hypothetical protein K2H15_06920, partial [Muribaculaceae bacterium]|nr:hypothetical protein [Muribaculaceae bacterium]
LSTGRGAKNGEAEDESSTSPQHQGYEKVIPFCDKSNRYRSGCLNFVLIDCTVNKESGEASHVDEEFNRFHIYNP